MSSETGGPAFPFPSGPEPRVDSFHDRCEGMTLRDWFAGMAITGLSRTDSPSKETQWAYELADAMIAERARAKKAPRVVGDSAVNANG